MAVGLCLTKTFALELVNKFFPVDQDIQKLIVLLGEAEKNFPQCGSLRLDRLIKLADFTCSCCSFQQASVLFPTSTTCGLSFSASSYRP